METQIKELIKQIAVKDERIRIMKEIDEADLPVGVWTLIRDIIIPKNK